MNPSRSRRQEFTTLQRVARTGEEGMGIWVVKVIKSAGTLTSHQGKYSRFWLAEAAPTASTAAAAAVGAGVAEIFTDSHSTVPAATVSASPQAVIPPQASVASPVAAAAAVAASAKMEPAETLVIMALGVAVSASLAEAPAEPRAASAAALAVLAAVAVAPPSTTPVALGEEVVVASTADTAGAPVLGAVAELLSTLQHWALNNFLGSIQEMLF
ncbi:MAG: hypothetical protein ACYCYP_10515 [Leptospirales bacterium]